ncbi:hypothetical protein Bca52824_094532 [Brassica carinata]|uniref:Exostosin GT47 domain-containing protein n=1 Tax=Brassica carinata TaxID=52824 RepID=A0A8X7P487_BRACI|nr:hypothetical protein Bca52824_094532 [Brassica carinata]
MRLHKSSRDLSDGLSQTPRALHHLKEYVDLIAAKYKFSNQLGADHFLVACHDWIVNSTK